MVSAFAPVNIAWVKYMGKRKGGPANSSFSMTLASLGSRTRIERIADRGAYEFDFGGSAYVPPAAGIEKIHGFLSNTDPFEGVLEEFGFKARLEPGLFRIHTSNNVPAGTGVATSASGFAALTLAWTASLAGDRAQDWVNRYREDDLPAGRLALVARNGSGSSCRSFHGPFVEWSSENRISSFKDSRHSFVDFILLFETAVKAVSSSEAHQRVLSSPGFQARHTETRRRLEIIKDALRTGDLACLSREVREEALGMHELFHTSVPPFRYLTEASKFWLSGQALQGTAFEDAMITADAGANIHVFLEKGRASEFEWFLKQSHPGIRFIRDQAGEGAYYDSPGF
jgi:diphosphomevalonate decarboxylase